MDRSTSGWISGLMGVIILSGSLPATRVAVKAFDPVFLTVARAAIARARFQHRRLAPCPQGPAQDGAGSSAFLRRSNRVASYLR
jgi:hypothetical protein